MGKTKYDDMINVIVIECGLILNSRQKVNTYLNSRTKPSRWIPSRSKSSGYPRTCRSRCLAKQQ